MRAPGFEFGKASKDHDAPFDPLEEVDDFGTLIGLDLRQYMDVCDSPQYRHSHAGLSWTWPLPGPNCPIMTASRQIQRQRFQTDYFDTGRRARQLWRHSHHDSGAVR